MNFRPDLADKVMARPQEKTVTRRLVSDNPNSPWWREKCGYRVGQEIAICPGRGKDQIGKARVVSVEKMRLGYVVGREALAEGFATSAEFKAAWEAINGSYDPDAVVWHIGLGTITDG